MRLGAMRLVGVVLAGLGGLSLAMCGGSAGPPGGPIAPPPPPVATPTPAPTPDPPVSQSCSKLPPGEPEPNCIRQTPPQFLGQVEQAIRTLQAEQPAIFDGDEVLSVGGYYVGLIRILDREGLCASTDGEELGVTDTSARNEQYDVLTAKNEARFGPNIYRTTCYPSSVPFALGTMPSQQGNCPLPPSREIVCSREPAGQYYEDVESAITEILKEKPDLFDFSQTAPGTDFPLVKDLEAYQQGVVDIMVGKGYCARYDFYEVGVKKGTNAFNEQYDIDLASRYVRRGPGIYRSSCYPSSF
jgi:hypothetical protein